MCAVRAAPTRESVRMAASQFICNAHITCLLQLPHPPHKTPSAHQYKVSEPFVCNLFHNDAVPEGGGVRCVSGFSLPLSDVNHSMEATRSFIRAIWVFVFLNLTQPNRRPTTTQSVAPPVVRTPNEKRF